MALSKQPVVQDVPAIAQHYLVCGTEDCENNCQFYCNPCHRQMCEQCRDEHQRSPENKNHEVVPYRQRNRKLPVEKCKDHPSKDIDMICENCQVAVCTKCAIKNHRGHTFDDLETIYSKNFNLCLDDIYKIYQYYLPTSQDLSRNVKDDGMIMKEVMDKIRASMKAEAESLQYLVGKVMSKNLEQANKMEKTLLEKLRSEDKTYDEYNHYLENLVRGYQAFLSFEKVQNNPILFSFSEHLDIKAIPDTPKPVYPVFTAGQYSEDDVAKLFGKITIPSTKPENREIQPMEIASTQLKPLEVQKEHGEEKSEVEQTLSLSSSVTKVREYTVPGVDCVYHISVGKSGRLCASDRSGNLVRTDLQGRRLQTTNSSCRDEGCHTLTQDEDMVITDKKNKFIERVTLDDISTTFIKTGCWSPLSIHSSNINGDILVGMSKDAEGKVTRYNKVGKEIQNIQRDIKGRELYSRNPHYITENINGDICVSDYANHAVVVVNQSGQHRLSYEGQGSEFNPYGICTDILGHILVCDTYSNKIHLLDQDGQFLSFLITRQQGLENICSVSVDYQNNLHVGQKSTSTVTVFNYLQ